MSQVVGVILILAVSIAVMTVAFSVVNHLPNPSVSNVNVQMGDLELLNPQDPTSNNGSLFFTMVYAGGPIVSGPNSAILIALNGSSYLYPLSSFNNSNNSWYPDLAPGSVVVFNSSDLVSSSGGQLNPIFTGSQITIEIIDDGKEIWSTSHSVQPQAIKQVIANSWVIGSPKQIFHIAASVFSENSVEVTGNFSLLYGPGTGPGAVFTNVSLTPMGGQEGYITQLPPVNFYSYYQIEAQVINSSGHTYTVSEWYQLGQEKVPVNKGGTAAGVAFSIVTSGHARPFSVTITVGNGTPVTYQYSSTNSNITVAMFLVRPGTVITINEKDIGQGGFVGYSGYQYASSHTVVITVNHPGTEYIDFNNNAGNEGSLAINVFPKRAGTVSWTDNFGTSGKTNLSFIITSIPSNGVVYLTESPNPDYKTIPASYYTFSNYRGFVNSTSTSITVSPGKNNVSENVSYYGPKTYNMTVDVSPNYSGDVYVVGGGVHRNVTNNTSPYNVFSNIIPGTSFSLTANGLADYSFLSYSGSVSSSSSTITITVNENITETGNFEIPTGNTYSTSYSQVPLNMDTHSFSGVSFIGGHSSQAVSSVSLEYIKQQSGDPLSSVRSPWR